MEIGLNDLPQYSSWCSKIMGLEKEKIHYKTPEEVKREYADEKWNEVCEWLEMEPHIRLDEVEKRLIGNETIATYLNGKFFLMEAYSARQKFYSFCWEKMNPYFSDMECLVELGSGYGSVILRLAANVGGKRKVFSGEYADSGLKAQSILAKTEGLDVLTGKCDFFSMQNDPVFSDARHGVVFTSWALAYVSILTSSIVDYFSEFEPQYVIHLEPCYEFYSMSTLHGQMCKRYMQLNDYNINLISILKEAEMNKKIEIVCVEKNFFGTNPLAPISMIVWKPI